MDDKQKQRYRNVTFLAFAIAAFFVASLIVLWLGFLAIGNAIGDAMTDLD